MKAALKNRVRMITKNRHRNARRWGRLIILPAA